MAFRPLAEPVYGFLGFNKKDKTDVPPLEGVDLLDAVRVVLYHEVLQSYVQRFVRAIANWIWEIDYINRIHGNKEMIPTNLESIEDYKKKKKEVQSLLDRINLPETCLAYGLEQLYPLYNHQKAYIVIRKEYRKRIQAKQIGQTVKTLLKPLFKKIDNPLFGMSQQQALDKIKEIETNGTLPKMEHE